MSREDIQKIIKGINGKNFVDAKEALKKVIDEKLQERVKNQVSKIDYMKIEPPVADLPTDPPTNDDDDED